MLLINNNIDFLGISETWLTSSVENSFLSIPGYEIVRHDSPSQRRKHGVAVYLRNHLKFNIIDCNIDNVLIIYLVDLCLYIVTVYRPPSCTSLENMQLAEFIEIFCFSKEVVVQGDFNLPNINWRAESCSMSQTDEIFLNTFTSLGLHQIIESATIHPSGNILDLFFANDLDRIGLWDVLPCLPNCAHSPVLVSYLYQSLPEPNFISFDCSAVERLWTKSRYDLLFRCLADIDWESELDMLMPDAQYLRFINIISPLIDRFVPPKVSSNRSSVPWTKNPPRELIRIKSQAWSAYKVIRVDLGRRHSSTIDAWNVFLCANDNIKNFAINSQKRYESSLGEQISFNPKLFHAYIKHRKIGRPTIGPLRLGDGSLSDDPIIMATCFAESFSSVFNSEVPNNPYPHQICSNEIQDITVSSDAVHLILSSLDPNSSLGSDGVHPRFLKFLADELSDPLAIIYNSSLQTGVVPVQWLSSIVVPIYKKSSRFNPLNYRPISLTSVTCKVLERIIVQHVTQYLDANNIISEQQFGFRAGHSTVDQLILTYNDISLSADCGKSTDLILFDFSKAFDLVNHTILITKLHHIGITGQVCDWIASFLSNRSMRVRVAGMLSHAVAVTSGVPQGSVLGPLLFIIYVNHIVAGLRTKYMIFADDLKMYLSNESGGDDESFVNALQADVDYLVSASSSWGLKLNHDKCVTMRFSPRNCNLPFTGISPYKILDNHIDFVDTHSDLGVLIDRSLKFHIHIRKKVGMVGGLTTNLLSCTLSRDAGFLMNIYKSHIRPVLDYASPLWNMQNVTDTKLLK